MHVAPIVFYLLVVLDQTTNHQWPLVLVLVNASLILVKTEEALSAHRVGAEHGEAHEPRAWAVAPPTHESGAWAAVCSRAAAAARVGPAPATRAGRTAPAIPGRAGVA